MNFIDEIWLYGSRARGDQQVLSDFDIAVVCPRASERDWQMVVEIIEEAKNLLKIDCVRVDVLSDDQFKKNILKFKKILYAKDDFYMSKLVWKDSFDSLGRAINRLKEVLELDGIGYTDYMQDAAIQRFEFSIELYWKVLKKFLSYEKVDAATPRDVFKKAFQSALIEDESVWLSMLDARNNVAHVYKEEDARRVFSNIGGYFRVMESTYGRLQKRYEEME